MCRSALEYPPNGKRCGKGEHLSAEEQKAHRDNQNAKRRANYAKKAALIKQENETNSVFSTTESNAKENNQTPLSIANSENSIKMRNLLNITTERVYDYRENNFSTEDHSRALNHMINTESSPLQGEVTGEDDNFASFTSNSVHRLNLKDGSVGYFKPLRSGNDYISKEAFEIYGMRNTQEVGNEISAYKLSQALGEGFDQLVPETTIREYNGKIGTIQKEMIRVRHDEGDDLDIEEKHEIYCAVFDYVAGSLDRHGNNYIETFPPREYKLIDNGFSFPDSEIPTGSIGVNKADFEDKLYYAPYHSEIIEKIQKLVDSPDGLGMKPYLSTLAYEGMMKRAKNLIANDSSSIEKFYKED